MFLLGADSGMKNRETFESYYQEYYSTVLKYIFKRINNFEQAEDLAMDVFAKCYDKFDEFDETKASFGTWLYVIVNNKLKNYYRDKKQFDEIDERMESISGFEDEIISAEYIKDMRNALADALETLNETQRRIVILKYFREKNASEIARIMGMTAVNVRVVLSRGISKIKEYFEKNNITWEN